jgi:Arc/MetJ-type ribon-helix-helix transcriptional regulator
MSQMITVRMPDDRVGAIDAAVADGAFPSRASLIIEAIDRLVAELERDAVDRALVEAYTQTPQSALDARWASVSGRRSVQAETW